MGVSKIFDINAIKTLLDSQRSNFYRAKVVSLEDPLNLNRIKIHIFGMTEDILEKSPESLPWCELQFTAGFSTYPVVDDIIWLFFEGGDIFRPIYLGTIYAGIDIDSKTGYDIFAKNLDAPTVSYSASTMGYDFKPVKDIKSYRSGLKRANNFQTNDHIILKDTVSHFDVITPETTWWRQFQGLEVVKSVEVDTKKVAFSKSLDPDYGPNPFGNQKIYPWYELRLSGDKESWQNIYGGWCTRWVSDPNGFGTAKFWD